MEHKLGVIGLGYVGLPLAVSFSKIPFRRNVKVNAARTMVNTNYTLKVEKSKDSKEEWIHFFHTRSRDHSGVSY